MTDLRIGELLIELENDEKLNEVQSGNLRLIRKSYDKATKLPTKFRSEIQAKAVQAGRTLFVRVEVDELFKKKRRDNIKIVK